ncbi:hypothetical protein HDU76_009210, partial [Blyttiomyces sp. JEL0837]
MPTSLKKPQNSNKRKQEDTDHNCEAHHSTSFNTCSSATVTETETNASSKKKVRFHSSVKPPSPGNPNPHSSSNRLLTSFGALTSHPQGVKPMGNSLLDDVYMSSPQNGTRSRGLGPFFSRLDDQLLISLFLSVGDDNVLIQDCDLLSKLTRCSKAWYVLCMHDEVWRGRTVRRYQGGFGLFMRSWRETFKRCLALEMKIGDDDGNEMETEEDSALKKLVKEVPLKVDGYYSDFLFTSWRCATIPLETLCRTKVPDNIDRRANLSVEDFIKEYAIPNKPVIMTDIVPTWPAYQKWSIPYLNKTYADVLFRAESVDLPFKSYASYSYQNSKAPGGSLEESPLYLFDKHFGSRTTLSNDFTVPPHFNQDLFGKLDRRPDYRWLIIGPARSGSTFHLDPNATSAWNAVVVGAKKWIMFPPEIIPPGVYPSHDGSEVTSPVSLAEWFMNHYDEMRSWPVKPIECICRAGEVIFVPRVSSENLYHVLRFLGTKPDQVSGFSGPTSCEDGMQLYEKFVEALGDEFVEVVEREKRERGIIGIGGLKALGGVRHKGGAMAGLFESSAAAAAREDVGEQVGTDTKVSEGEGDRSVVKKSGF